MRSRRHHLRLKEDLKRQEAFLDEAYRERERERVEFEAGLDDWDPIEDVLDGQRGNYIDLIRHILLMDEAVNNSNNMEIGQSTAASSNNTPQPLSTSIQAVAGKKSKKSKPTSKAAEVAPAPDKSAHDTRLQIRQRLSEGVEHSYSGGVRIAGTIENPHELYKKTAPIPDEEIDQLLYEIAEIKQLLFCRLLLSHAAVLPAALKASSMEEFLNDPDVSETDLRDLCLKLDDPGLQAIRDACADLSRGEEEALEEPDQRPEESVDTDSDEDFERRQRHYGLRGLRKDLDAWTPKREKAIEQKKNQPDSIPEQSEVLPRQNPSGIKPTMIDFGDIEDKGEFKSRKMRVKVCGRYIYNYPSENAVSRSGWFHFCIIAKDSDLNDAIRLCRHWDEFWELNILANFQYFPARNWTRWKGDPLRQMLLQLVSFSS